MIDSQLQQLTRQLGAVKFLIPFETEPTKKANLVQISARLQSGVEYLTQQKRARQAELARLVS